MSYPLGPLPPELIPIIINRDIQVFYKLSQLNKRLQTLAYGVLPEICQSPLRKQEIIAGLQRFFNQGEFRIARFLQHNIVGPEILITKFLQGALVTINYKMHQLSSHEELLEEVIPLLLLYPRPDVVLTYFSLLGRTPCINLDPTYPLKETLRRLIEYTTKNARIYLAQKDKDWHMLGVITGEVSHMAQLLGYPVDDYLQPTGLLGQRERRLIEEGIDGGIARIQSLTDILSYLATRLGI